MLFYPVEQTQTNKGSWIISSAIGFGQYSEALTNIRHYRTFVRNSIHQFSKSFSYATDKRHQKVLNMTWHDVNNTVDTLDQTYPKLVSLIKVMRGQTQNQRIFKRSILPLGGY